MKTLGRIFIYTLAFLVLAISAYAQAPSSQEPIHIRNMTPEQWGDERMAAGRYDSALRDYAQQWVTLSAGFNENVPETQVTRERIVGKMAQALSKLGRPPAVVEYSEFHAQKGAAFVKLAKTPADYAKAVKEFQDAVNHAPWVFDYHYNLAVAYKLAGQFKLALNSLSLAKLLAPGDGDRRDINRLRAEIEAAQELNPN